VCRRRLNRSAGRWGMSAPRGGPPLGHGAAGRGRNRSAERWRAPLPGARLRWDTGPPGAGRDTPAESPRRAGPLPPALWRVDARSEPGHTQGVVSGARIRPVERGDVAACAEVEREAFGAASSLEASRRLIARLVRHPGVYGVVAERGGAIVG